MEGKRHAIWQVRCHQMCDVFLLPNDDARFVDGDVNIEEIRYGSFIFHVPAERKGANKVIVQ
eukprot:670860-Pleurochrysis_carterae.AAC.1